MSPPCCLIKCRLDGLSVSEKEMSRRNKKKQTSANKNTRRTNMKWDDTRWKWIWDEYDKERKETILWESRRRGRDRLIDWKGWMILLVSLSTLLLFSPSFILSILSTTIPRAIPYGSEEAQAGKEVSLIILQLLWIPRAITDSQSVHSSSSSFFFFFFSFFLFTDPTHLVVVPLFSLQDSCCWKVLLFCCFPKSWWELFSRGAATQAVFEGSTAQDAVHSNQGDGDQVCNGWTARIGWGFHGDSAGLQELWTQKVRTHPFTVRSRVPHRPRWQVSHSLPFIAIIHQACVLDLLLLWLLLLQARTTNTRSS